MRDFTAARVGALAPSGIRKVNEKALAMERAGERVIHFEIGRPDFDTPAYIKEAAARSLRDGRRPGACATARCSTPRTSA